MLIFPLDVNLAQSVNAKHHNFNSWKSLWMYFVKSVIEYQTENGHGKNGISKIGI